jgi:predicted nucleotidyltransferase
MKEKRMPDDYVAYWKKQQATRRHENQVLADEARQDLDRIVQHLHDEYEVERVILFGSLAKNRFTLSSDIDLAVAGLTAANFFTAYADLTRLTRFRIDLKPFDDSLHPHFYRRVLERGEILYEKSDGA